MNDTIERSQTHATFVIERTYPVPVAAVWHALSDNDARDQWFGGGPTFDVREKSHDFRVGGHGIEDGQWHGGPRSRFVSTYTDIVDRQRIVFTYDMWVDDQHLSTSADHDRGGARRRRTRLTYTEQGVHFDGLDTVEGREEGTRGTARQPRLLPRAGPLRPGPPDHRNKESTMTIVTAQMSVSADGFYAGQKHTDIPTWLNGPEAAGFFRVTRWAIDAEAWRQRLGFKGGERNANSTSSRKRSTRPGRT